MLFATLVKKDVPILYVRYLKKKELQVLVDSSQENIKRLIFFRTGAFDVIIETTESYIVPKPDQMCIIRSSVVIGVIGNGIGKYLILLDIRQISYPNRVDLR